MDGSFPQPRADSSDIRSADFVATDLGDGLTLEGYAAVFNSPTRISDWEGEFDETIAPGAFARSLAQRSPVLMFQHGKHPLIGDMPLGRITDAREDDHGLFISARLSDNWLIQPVRDAIRDGAVEGMSFRFAVPQGGDEWEKRDGDVPLRTLRSVNVSELGPVVFPAYEPTSVAVRSALNDLTGNLERGAQAVTPDTPPGNDAVSTPHQRAALLRALELNPARKEP